METQYKLAARSAQLLAKDAPQDEAARVMATMAKAKTQLSKVGFVKVNLYVLCSHFYAIIVRRIIFLGLR